MLTVGERIRLRRMDLNMSQEELANKAGYSGKPAISKFENAGNDITMKQVYRLAPALETSVAYLMGWETNAEVSQKNESKVSSLDIAIRDAMIEPYDTDQIKHAVDVCKKYLAADPNLQNAIDLLLKGNQSDV